MSAAFLKDRIERLARMFEGVGVGIDRPLLKAVPINTRIITELAVKILGKSIGLDNITPGGAVMDRTEIKGYYDLLRTAVLIELENEGISHWSPPILRAPLLSYPSRPYSTEKMHSDIWRGEPRYSMNVIIPLWGCEHSIVTFREPEVDTFTYLDSYDAGITAGEDYAVPFEEGFAYYFDSMLLHQTVRTGPGQRASVDLRGLYSERVVGEEKVPASRYLEIA